MSQLTNLHGHEIEQKSEARCSDGFLQPCSSFSGVVVNKVMGLSAVHAWLRCRTSEGALWRARSPRWDVFPLPGLRTASGGDGPALAVFFGPPADHSTLGLIAKTSISVWSWSHSVRTLMRNMWSCPDTQSEETQSLTP